LFTVISIYVSNFSCVSHLAGNMVHTDFLWFIKN